MMTARVAEQKADQPISAPGIVAGFAELFACLLIGQASVSALKFAVPSLTFPGAIGGLIVLLIYLSARRHVPAGIGKVSTILIALLSLMFVPVAVSVMEHGSLVAIWAFPLLLAIAASTLATLLVTVGVFLLVQRKTGVMP